MAASPVVRSSLTAEELSAAMPISISLRMRSFTELQARIASGEQISSSEMDEKYRPLKSDYENVTQWLVAQGFDVTLNDSTHTNLFARASVARVSQTLGVQMARVAGADGEYTAAISAPHVPQSIAAPILSVNGLQPQLRLRHMRAPRQMAGVQPADVVGNSAYVTPNNIASAYHVPLGLDGTGQTIAVVDGVPVQINDVTAFWAETGVSQKASNLTIISGDGIDSTDVYETALDIEWAGAMAPGAKIREYVGADPIAELSRVLNDLPTNPTISVVSVSYGEGENQLSPGMILTYSQTFAQFAAAGVTVFASSGDGGSNSSFEGTYGSYSITNPLYQDYPGCDVDVTCVGGTQVDFDAGWNVLGETAWDDLTLSQSATGGGSSTVFQRPVWQTGGTVLAGQSMRCFPDVAAVSVALAPPGGIPLGNGTTANGEFMSLIVVNGGNGGIGGTSLATPIWAAFGAIINQARFAAGNRPIGLLGPNIYPLAGTSAFNDITIGSNGAYSARPGYDLCTGLGSPNLTALLAALTNATPPSTFFSPSAPNIGSTVQAPVSTVMGGTSISMSVTASGNFGPLAYQWSLDNTPIVGATSATYSIASVRGNDRGAYSVQVSNDFGSTTVSMGTVTVLAPTATITSASPSGVAPGSAATMSVSAQSSGGTLSYQWAFDGTDIPGALQPNLTVTDIGAGNAGDYTLDIRDSNGLTEVDLGYLTLNGPNYLTPYSFTSVAEPADVSLQEGSFALPLAVDGAGNIYLASGHSTIVKVTPEGIETTLAGNFGVTGSADGVGTAATFGTYLSGIAVDKEGTVYVADTSNSTIRTITTSGVVSTVAGNAGSNGSADGTGAAAQFRFPQGIAVDRNGTLYVADTENSTIRVVHPGGIVTTMAGNPAPNVGNADGIGSAAQFDQPTGIAVDENGNVFVADTFNQAIRRITPDGHVTTLAGNSKRTGSLTSGITGSTDGTGAAALFTNPQGVAVDPTDNVYVADTDNNTIRRISPSGVVTTLAGVPGIAGTSDGTGSAALFNSPSGIAVGANGVLYVQSASIRIGVFAANAPPIILAQPVPQTIATGSTVTFGVSSSGPVTYQWSLNGAAVQGAVYSSLVIHGATAADAGSYTCTLTNSQGSVVTEAAALRVVSTADPGRLINLSCRAQVGTGASVLIAGFAIGGSGTTGPESVLVRASGPSLTSLNVPGALRDPSLQLHDAVGTIGSDTGWMGSPSLAAIFAQVGAFSWTNPASLDSALFESLATGSYSAVISGATSDSGVALAEIYDATPPGIYTPATPRLVNLSSRVEVGIGANILIAGFVIGGSTSETVLIRGSGPALSAFGVPGILPDPQLQLNNSTGMIASNTGWGGDMQLAAIADSVGAFSWGSTSTPDSALLVTLPPGAYTVEVAGSSGDTGVALVEVYEVP